MKFFTKYSLHLAWIVALISMFGSLYFSEIQHLPPCSLCWYQRILMYPLVVILAIGMLRRDTKLHQYVLPFSIGGTAVALYHNLLYYKILPEGVQPCSLGVSCTSVQLQWFGLITIPMLSLAAFAVISVCVLAYRRAARANP